MININIDPALMCFIIRGFLFRLQVFSLHQVTHLIKFRLKLAEFCCHACIRKVVVGCLSLCLIIRLGVCKCLYNSFVYT